MKKIKDKDIKNRRFLGSLRDFKESQRDIRKGILIGLGLAAITAEKAEKIVKAYLKKKK